MNYIRSRYATARPVGALLSALLLASGLRAQSTAAAPAAPEAPSGATSDETISLDQFVVRGTDVSSFRSESVQVGTFRNMNPVDVPMTINAVTQDVVEAQEDQSLMGALRNTAGVTMYELGGATYSNIAIRGISLQNRTNFRLNGAIPLINLIEFPLEAMDRVEVLKGAAAIYYGYVTPSGVVNYVTKRPMQNPYESATFSVNGYGAYGGNVDVSERVNTSRDGYFGVRVNAGAFQMNPGVDNYDGYRDFVTVAADWRVSDKVLMRFDYMHIKETVSEISYLSLPVVSGVALVPPPPATTFNMGNTWMKSNQSSDDGLLRTDIIITPNWTVLTELGIANLHRSRNNDSFSLTSAVTGAGTLTVPFAKNQRYQNDNGRVELYGQYQTGPVNQYLSIGVTGNLQQQDSPTAPSEKIVDNFYNPVQNIPQTDLNTVPVVHSYNPIKDYGPYFFDRLTFDNERIQAVGGVRYEEYYNGTGAAYPLTTIFRASSLAPAVSLVFKPTADSSVYASYMSGLEESGIAPATASNAYQVLPPLTSTQYELGSKAQLWGGTLIQLGLFELRHPGTFTNAANALVPNGLTKTDGAELSVSGEVVPTVSLIGSAMLLSDRQTDAANPATYGLQSEDTPKQTLSGLVLWRTPLSGLNANAGAYYSARKSVNNSDQGWVGGYTMYSAGLSYDLKIGKGHYIVRAAGDNLTNKRAWTAAGANLLSGALPRIVKFSITESY